MKTPKHELVDEKKARQSRSSTDNKEARRLKKLLERETREEIARSRKFDIGHEQNQRNTFGNSLSTHPYVDYNGKSSSGDSAQLLDFPIRREDPFADRHSRHYTDHDDDTARHHFGKYGHHGNHGNHNNGSCCPPKPDYCTPSSCPSDYCPPKPCFPDPSPKKCHPHPHKPKSQCCVPKPDCCPQKSHCDCDKLEYTWPTRWLTSGLCSGPDDPPDPPVEQPVPPCQSYTCNGTLLFEGLKPNVDLEGSSVIWERELVTPQPLKCTRKKLLCLDVTTSDCEFNFNVKISNQVETGCTNPDPDSFNINPKSCDTPLTLGNYVRISDPTRTPAELYDSYISYYTADEGNLNQFTYAVDTFRTGQNLLLFNQLFFIHVGQNRHNAKLTITSEPELGENQFRVKIDTPCQVEIKENITCVKVDPEQFDSDSFPDVGGVSIKQHIVYVGGTYFFTYAYYIGNQRTARDWVDYTFQEGQAPFQLLAMVLFCPLLPVPDIFRAYASTSQQRHLKQMYLDLIGDGVVPDGESSCYYPCRNYLPDCNSCQPCCGQQTNGNGGIGPDRVSAPTRRAGARVNNSLAAGRSARKTTNLSVKKNANKKTAKTEGTGKVVKVIPSKRIVRNKTDVKTIREKFAEKRAQKLALATAEKPVETALESKPTAPAPAPVLAPASETKPAESLPEVAVPAALEKPSA